MTQYVINIGTIPNDGTGDPLRTAFNETNLNFDQVFAAGPVGSNVQIVNNTILTTNTNGNLVLAPNGVGVVQANVNIVPNTSNIRNLGAADRRWATLYIQYANISGSITVSDLTATGNVTVAGNLSVTGNVINIGNIITDAKTIQLANTAGTANAADGSGITVGANDNIATFLFSSTANAWTTNIGLNVTGNIIPAVSNTYSLGNSTNWWSNVWVAGNTIFIGGVPLGIAAGNVLTVGGNAVLQNNSNTAISTTGNISTGNVLTGGVVSAAGNVRGANFNTAGAVSATGNITANNIAITGDRLDWANASIVQTSASDFSITGDGQVTVRSLDGTYQWTFDNAGNLTAPGNIGTSANVSANYFLGNGSQLTGLSTSSISNGNSNVDIPTANGNVTVTTAGDYTWTFGTDGALTIPNDIIGSATIDIDNRATGNSADINLYSADDILLQARDRTLGSGSEGGDINIFAGDSAEDGDSSGGDVTIEAGNGGAANVDFGGSGGFVTVRAGTGGDASTNVGGASASGGGALTLSAGDAGSNMGNIDRGSNGGDVSINAGDSTGNNSSGGDIFFNTGSGGANALSGGLFINIPASGQGPGGSWAFNADGTTIYPTLTVTRGDRTGTLTGQALLFGDSTQEALISTPNGTSDINASQRLVINPGAGYTGTAGEGGDIYLYAGRGGDAGGSGGDIKIRGGLGPVNGDGGYIDIIGGEADADGQGGRIDIQGGQSGNSTGGPVQIYGGQGINGGDANITGGVSTAGPGGAVNITGGTSSNGLAEYGNVNITAGASTWTFDNTGKLRAGPLSITSQYGLGTTGTILEQDGTLELVGNGTGCVLVGWNSSYVTLGNVAQMYFNPAGSSGNIVVTTGNLAATSYEWTFDNTGTFTAPGNIAASNFVGGGSNVDIVAGSYSWTFDNGGVLAAPGQINATSISLSGTGTAVNASSGNILTNKVTGTQFAFLNGLYTATLTGSGATSDYTLNLPANAGSNGQVLTTDGSGNLSWTTAAGGGYGNANVATFLAAYGSNTISTTGTITSGNILGNGYARLTGSFDESQASTAGLYLGYAGGTARIMFGTGNTSQTLEIDNDGGTLRFYKPGTTLASLTNSGAFSAAGNITGANIVTSGSMSATGNVTAANFIGNISITGNVTGTSANVTLVAGAYSWTFDNTGNLQGNVSFTGANVILNNPVGSGGPDEGGQLQFAVGTANTSLAGPIAIDVYQNRMRVFETTGNTRGVYIDLAKAPAGVSGELQFKASALVNAGVDVTLGNLRARIPTSGNRSLQVSTVSGTYSVYGSAQYTAGGTIGGTYIDSGSPLSVTTTPAYLASGNNFANGGDAGQWVIMDTSAGLSWRISFIIGSAYNNNMITIERMV